MACDHESGPRPSLKGETLGTGSVQNVAYVIVLPLLMHLSLPTLEVSGFGFDEVKGFFLDCIGFLLFMQLVTTGTGLPTDS